MQRFLALVFVALLAELAVAQETGEWLITTSSASLAVGWHYLGGIEVGTPVQLPLKCCRHGRYHPNVSVQPSGSLASPWEAIRSFDKSIDNWVQLSDLTDIESLYVARGNAYLVAGQLKEALADYNRVLRTQPRNSRALFYRALLRHRMGEYRLALRDFDAASESCFEYRRLVKAHIHRFPDIYRPTMLSWLELADETLYQTIDRIESRTEKWHTETFLRKSEVSRNIASPRRHCRGSFAAEYPVLELISDNGGITPRSAPSLTAENLPGSGEF